MIRHLPFPYVLLVLAFAVQGFNAEPIASHGMHIVMDKGEKSSLLRRENCPDLDPDSCEPWRARIVQLIQFYEYDVHPQARQQGIYISSSLASRVPDGDLWHVVGDIHQHQLVLDVRRELSLQWYRLELYEVIGVIPNNRNIRRFEQLMRNTPPPGPGLLGGNNQDWTRKVLEIGLARCLIIPIGRLLMDPEWN